LFILESVTTRKHTSAPPTADELQALKAFNAQSGLALSIYLDLDSAEKRVTAEETLRRLLHAQVRAMGIHGEAQETLQEDFEIIQLYLNTNGSRNARGLAIFSCANEFFWRAYPLPVPIGTHVHIAPHLDTEHLADAFEDS
jgi:hypothetical protein